MPRPLRIEFKNAWYHVMNRGAGYQEIFKTDKHRKIFLELLADASSLFGVKVHAYCLMDNHYHLLVNTPRTNLSQVMRHINGLYTQRFNRTVKRDGPLFRGRYKAIVVDHDSYLLQVTRYIHLNPVVAKICAQPKAYRWSSYQYYIQGKDKPFWLKTDEILSMISQRNREVEYKRFVMSGLDQETKTFYKKTNTSSIFGSKQFKDKLLKRLNSDEIIASKTDYNSTRELPLMSEINGVVADFFNINEAELYQGGRGIKNDARKIAIYACRTWASEKLSVIADRYQCRSHSNISNVVTEIKNRLLREEKLIIIVKKLRKEIFDH